MARLAKSNCKSSKIGHSGYKNGYFENMNPQTLVLQGIPAFSFQKYGLKAARRAPQFSKRQTIVCAYKQHLLRRVLFVSDGLLLYPS